MPEKDLHLFDLTRLHAHDGRDKHGHDVERWSWMPWTSQVLTS
jgi:hypothetical protein